MRIAGSLGKQGGEVPAPWYHWSVVVDYHVQCVM